MNFIRVILLILLFLLGRRVYRNFVAMGRPARGVKDRPESGKPSSAMKDLTDQDISDADFEEIP